MKLVLASNKLDEVEEHTMVVKRTMAVERRLVEVRRTAGVRTMAEERTMVEERMKVVVAVHKRFVHIVAMDHTLSAQRRSRRRRRLQSNHHLHSHHHPLIARYDDVPFSCDDHDGPRGRGHDHARGPSS